MDALAKLNKKELAQFETLAAGLKNDGYTGAVVCRKMISQHGMEEAAATALVSRLYGKEVDPRRGDTAFAVTGGLVLAGTSGILGSGIFYFLGFNQLTWTVGGGLLAVAGGAIAKVIIAMVNADVKEDLRAPKRDD